MSKDIKIRVFIDSEELQSSFVAIQENKETENGSSVLKHIAQEYDMWVIKQRLSQSPIEDKEII